MYPAVLLLLSVAIFVLLLQVYILLALAFLIAALILIPTLVLHRREATSAVTYGLDSESHRQGLLRLAGLLTVDLSGVAIGTLILFLGILLLHLASEHH